MRFHFAVIPVFGSDEAEAALNQFPASTRVASVDRELIVDGPRSAWAVCVSYSPSGGKTGGRRSSNDRVDYKEVLPPNQFKRFAALRDLRKQVASADAVPPYAVFNNQQLADMVRGNMRTLAEVASLDGVGPARVQKYGQRFLDRLSELSTDASNVDES